MIIKQKPLITNSLQKQNNFKHQNKFKNQIILIKTLTSNSKNLLNN